MAYYFKDFVLDPRTGTLKGPQGVVPLRRQAFRLCEVLLQNAPNLLTRDQLLDEVWGKTVVSPNALPQTISELRHALGDDSQAPTYIETKHRKGYRVICEVKYIAQDELEKSAENQSRATRSKPVVASANPIQKANFNRLLLASTLVTLTFLALWLLGQDDARETLYRDTIPDIRSALDSDVFLAWKKTREALKEFPDNPDLHQLLLDLSIPVSLESDPPGALLHVGPYNALDSDWVPIGEAPLQEVRLPLTMLRFNASKPGYVELDVAPSVLPFAETFYLHLEAATPPGMVFVPAGRSSYMGETQDLPAFWIQRNEVTNQQYYAFVEAGGYERPEFWNHRAEADGRVLQWDELMSRLVDSTGLPGPSTWSMGVYPEGEANHPVEGVSWFEAEAYAQYAGLELASVFHWWRAAGFGGPQQINFSDIVKASNFASRSTSQVGSGGLGPFGTRDMAGNVGEWCTNGSVGGRHFLGGSWLTSAYAFNDAHAQPALSRGQGFGFRLIRADEPIPPEALAVIDQHKPEQVLPVSDEIFAIFSRQFDYDETPLEAQVEDIDYSQRSWRRERVTFDAAYGDDRVILQLLIPTIAKPPYQVVVHFPGGDALMLSSSREAGLISVEPFLRTGRAVAYPVYQGTFERRGRRKQGPLSVRKQLIEQVQDLRRTIDYLETREDMDTDKLAFHGLSYGAVRAPFILAVENRFATALILSTGILPVALPPEITLQHYLPRVTLPTLFVTGRDDFGYPYEAAQKPFFELLGTPQEQKKHVILDGGHLPTGYAGLIREVIAWLDEWLGET